MFDIAFLFQSRVEPVNAEYWRIQDSGQRGQWSFDPRGAGAQNLLQNRGFYLKIASKLRDFEKKSWGQGGARAPRQPGSASAERNARGEPGTGR